MRFFRAAAPLLGLGLVLAACSGGGATPSPVVTAAPTPSASAPASVEPSAAPSAAPSASAATGGVTVNLAETSLGTILVDGAGKTLYVFTPDTAGGISTCYDDCATAWPPLAADAVPTPGTGLDAGDFALVDRTDGSKQVTFHGMPLYYFASDAAAGDTKGQGLGEKWYVVDADGKLIK